MVHQKQSTPALAESPLVAIPSDSLNPSAPPATENDTFATGVNSQADIGASDMDVDPDTMSSVASISNPGQLLQLHRTINQLTIDATLASAKISSLHGEARQIAVRELQDLSTTIRTSIDLLNHLRASNATSNVQSTSPRSVPSSKVVCPNNLPHFQWEGSVFDERNTIFVDVDACLTKFQDVMFAYNLDFDAEFGRLVPPMLSPTQRTWYQSFVANSKQPTWAEFKASFKARYGLSVLDDRQKCTSDLVDISLNPEETLDSFVDRFNDLRRRAFDQVPPPFLLVSRFMLALPQPLRSQVNIVRQSKEAHGDVSVDFIIRTARDLLASMTPSEAAAAMSHKEVVKHEKGTKASKWASTSAADNSHSSIPIQGAAASKISKPSMKKSTGISGRFCDYHKSKGHNTSECQAYAAKLAEQVPATPTSNSSSSSQATGRPFQTTRPSCRDCGAPNYAHGHVCNTATRTGEPPKVPERRFRMMRITDAQPTTAETDTASTVTPASSATSASSSAKVTGTKNSKFCIYHKRKSHNTSDCNAYAAYIATLSSKALDGAKGTSGTDAAPSTPGTSPSVVTDTVAPSATSDTTTTAAANSASATTTQSTSASDDAMDVDVVVATEAHKCKLNEFSNLPINKSNSLLVPLIVESYKVYGVLDTGCTFSICAPQFAKSLGIHIDLSTDGHIQLGHTSTTKPRIGSCYLNIFYNKRNFKHKFEVFDFYTDSNDCPVLLGLDIMSQLNIGITGLTSSWFEYTGPELPSPIDPDVEPNNDPYGSPTERNLAYAQIEPLLKENANIDLASTYCNLPGAIVQLETIPNKIAYRAPYPVPIVYKEAVLAQLDQWQKDGVIERSPSHTGWNHPLLVVAKKNSAGVYSFDKPRIVADVRLFNQILVSTDKYQMPRIDDIHQRFSAAKIISSIDVKSFFTSFLVDRRFRFKLSFSCPFTNQQYMWRKVCFGISFIGNLTSRCLSNLFSDMREHVCLYVDDIGVLSFNDSLEEHTQLLAEVIRRLTDANLQINPDKIVFAQRSVHVLGWSIIHNRLVPDSRKLTNFHTWPIPKTGKDIMRYLGFTNYFRSAIPGYGTLAAPLDELRNHKSLATIWNDTHTTAFYNLQKALASSTALSPIDFRYKVNVATDASATAVGGIIYQIKDNTVHYITMASRKLSKSEMAYSTTKRELLAIVYMFTKFHKWLFGIPFILHTDHRSLVWLQTQSTPNMMLLTWYEVIFFHYTYDIIHIPGSRNILPDALSRLFPTDTPDDNKLEGGNLYNNTSIFVKEKRRNHKRGDTDLLTQTNNRDSSLLKPKKQNNTLFKKRFKKSNFKYSSFPTKHDINYHTPVNNDIDVFDASTYNDISSSKSNDYNDNSLTNNDSPSIKNSDTLPHNHNILISRAMKYADYMTPPESERIELILKVHLLGHVGINAIEKILHNDYAVHWTHMRDDITRVLKDCHACQSHGIFSVGYHPPRSVLPDNVFDHIAVDLGDFATTSTSGNNYILVIVDYFSRFTILRALPDKSPVTIARSLLSVCSLFGWPVRITSDNANEFVGTFIREFLELSGLDRLTSLPYTPTGNSLVESFMGVSKRAIIKSLTHDAAEPESWDLYLDVIQYAMNIQYARLHKSQPFSVMFNRAPNLFKDYSNSPAPAIDINNPNTEIIDKRLKYVKEVVIPAIHKRIQETQLKDHATFERTHKIVYDKYPINSKVMIVNPIRTSKLSPRWLGPYLIKNYTRHGSYVLADLTGELLSRDVATQHIRVIDSSENHLTHGFKDRHYEVQAIVNHRIDKDTGEMFYRTNWVGYQKDDDTWQRESDFDSKKPIRDYWARINPTKLGAPLPNTVNKRKLNRRRKHAGPTVNRRHPNKKPNSKATNQETLSPQQA